MEPDWLHTIFNFVATCNFWHNFCVFFVFDEICGHISTYMKFNISPIQTQMEGPLILEPNIFQICWTIESRFLSNLFSIYFQFTFKLVFYFQFTCNLLSNSFLRPTITDLVFKHIHFYSSIEPFCLLLFHKSEQNKCLPKNIAGAVGHWNTKLTTFLSVCLFTPCFSLSEKLTF